MEILKDIISLFFYVLITPFYTNKDAVLVYHSIDNIDRDEDPHKMNVKPALFERHMGYLSERRGCRYTITFDDGFESVYTNAFPILTKYNMKAIVFLTIDHVHSTQPLKRFFNNSRDIRSLTWEQARDMQSRGVEIGSHALTHRNMVHLDEETFYGEAKMSREAIESALGHRVDSFSYPFGNAGSFSRGTTTILKEIGYKRAYTNIMGMDNSSKEPFAARRIRIYERDNIFRFKMKMAGAYNWVDSLAPLSALFSFMRGHSCPK